jgi:hypothetical protein
VNRPALRALSIFVNHPTYLNSRALICVPALYKILEMEYCATQGSYPGDILGVVRWMTKRADEVLRRVLALNTAPLELLTTPAEHLISGGEEIRDWEKVSSYFEIRKGTHESSLDWMLVPAAADTPEALIPSYTPRW